MTDVARTFLAHPDPRKVKTEEGRVLDVPEGWEMLPPGDAGLTRKLKSLGPSWTVRIRKRRRWQSVGVWAPAENLEEARRLVEGQRSRPEYARRLASDRARRDRRQVAYVEEFAGAVFRFLAFDGRYHELAERLSRAVSAHATPVGSGTVARTERIPVEERAEAAVIAWMRHQTTEYDNMRIARVKGKRREVRRMLADRSRQVLDAYRRGEDVASAACPLRRALETEA